MCALTLTRMCIHKITEQVRSPSMCDDSDSDMEDFLSVLEDSEMGLKIADHALKKKYGNPMGTGLAVKPNIYVG